MEIELLPLKCPNCGNEILSTETDNLYFCSYCGKGFQVEKGAWKEIKTVFAKPVLPSPENHYIYLPFWGIRTRLTFKEKPRPEVNIWGRASPINPFLEKKLEIILKNPESSSILDFFIPGFGTTNRYLLMDNIGLEYTLFPPSIHTTNPVPMLGGKYTLKDALIIAKSLLLTMQEDSRFFLKHKFELTPLKFFVIGIPFYREKGFLIEALKGKKMFFDSVENIDKILEKLKRR